MRFVESKSSDGVQLSTKLQKGVFINFLPGETVTAFILRVLSLSEESMKREIQTLILNNACVDEPDTRELFSGDTLVLSGAMPGLVGAMLRSNSPIKVMRQTLSASVHRTDPTVPESMIRLKLFNTVLAEHKEALLKVGFYLDGEDV